MPLEEEMKLNWPYVAGKNNAKAQGLTIESKSRSRSPRNKLQELAADAVKTGQSVFSKVSKTEAMKTESGTAVTEKNWFGKLADDPNLALFVKTLEKEV